MWHTPAAVLLAETDVGPEDLLRHHQPPWAQPSHVAVGHDERGHGDPLHELVADELTCM